MRRARAHKGLFGVRVPSTRVQDLAQGRPELAPLRRRCRPPRCRFGFVVLADGHERPHEPSLRRNPFVIGGRDLRERRRGLLVLARAEQLRCFVGLRVRDAWQEKQCRQAKTRRAPRPTSRAPHDRPSIARIAFDFIASSTNRSSSASSYASALSDAFRFFSSSMRPSSVKRSLYSAASRGSFAPAADAYVPPPRKIRRASVPSVPVATCICGSAVPFLSPSSSSCACSVWSRPWSS